MKPGMQLIVYPVKDIAHAKALFREVLGVEPYADAPYYVGFRVGRPPTCPHGNPIPRDGRTSDRPEGVRLSEASRGGEVTILRVTEEAEEDARLLTFLQEHGLRPGNVFAVD